MANFTVIYDACVLYPATLRDFLMELAIAGLFRAKWSDEIHDEWIRSVLKSRPDLNPAQLQRTRELMDAHAEDCLVQDYEDLIPAIVLPDAYDRHVVAAAIRGGADTIVTFNLKHFPPEVLKKYDLEAQHPDDFVVHQIGLSEASVCKAAKRHRVRLKNPPRSIEEHLSTLARQGMTQTVTILRRFAEVL